MARYTLPDLPYDYGALEPHIRGHIMELHHDKHHAGYVSGANQALDELAEAQQKNDFHRIATLERALAFNLSGHVLHSLFWRNLVPGGGGRPTGVLGDAITRDFGGFDRFQHQLVECAATIMGSGWGALCWDPVGQRLMTAQIHDHQSEITQAGIPILVIDAWEHAYYLQYENEKTKFFAALFHLWNWDDVAARFDKVKEVDLELSDVVEGVSLTH